MSEKEKRVVLPSDPIAALLLHGNDKLDLKAMAQAIGSGAWPIEPGYTHEGRNLIEILAANSALSGRPVGCSQLIGALLDRGVALKPDTWRLAKEDLAQRNTMLLLQMLEEGEDFGVARGACMILHALRPITPVAERAKKALALVEQAGGWSAPVQGIPLASWLVLHDDKTDRGGYTQISERESQTQTRERIRQRVHGDAMQSQDQWQANILDRRLLQFRMAGRDKYGDLTSSFAGLKPDMVKQWLDEVPAQGRVKSMIADRLLTTVVSQFSSKEQYYSSIKLDRSKLPTWREDISSCLAELLRSPMTPASMGADNLSELLKMDISLLRELPAVPACAGRLVETIHAISSEGHFDGALEAVQAWGADCPEAVTVLLDGLEKLNASRTYNVTPEVLAARDAFVAALRMEFQTLAPVQAGARRSVRL